MRRLLLVIALLGLTACGETAGDNKASGADSTTTTAPTVTPTGGTPETSTTKVPFKGSAAPVATADTAPATLTAIDIGLHDGFERIVFRFSDHVPGLRLQPSPGPFAADGSGKPVEVDGNAFLALRMTANGHDEDGQPNVPMRIRGPKGHSVVEIVRLGDYEAVLSFAIGLEAPQTFRVLQLQNPPRIAIDISSN